MRYIVKQMCQILGLLLCVFITSCNGGGGGSSSSSTSFTIGGNVYGLSPGTTVVLKDNGDNTLTINSNGAFQFTQTVPQNGSYLVTVATQPTGEVCTVTFGSGTGVVANVGNVNVICSDKSYTIGGTVSGLAAGSQVTITNNGDNPMILTQNGAFAFFVPVARNSGYSIVVTQNPVGETCSVINGSGYGITSNIANVKIICSNKSYSIGGTVSGLRPGEQVTIENNGANRTIITKNGLFVFSKEINYGGSYLVNVNTQPAHEICTPNFNVGHNVHANVTNVAIVCHFVKYTISGVANGLESGTQITLLNNGVDPVILPNPTNGSIQFTFQVAYGSGYNITIGSQDGVSCKIVNGSGTNVQNNISNVVVNCKQQYFILHTFTGSPADGDTPNGGLILGNDSNFYGTTMHGGAYSHGTIFKITPSGDETLLYSFKGGESDGAEPMGSLFKATDGNLYGVTYNGGEDDKGTIFKITPSGDETLLYSFIGNPDGSHPMGELLQDGVDLYGTTSGGGSNSGGSIFKINITSGHYSSLYSFQTLNYNGSYDGNGPVSGLIKATDGNFYGTTPSGGSYGSGTIYRFTPGTNDEHRIHSMNGGSEGGTLRFNLLQASDGNLYGTTSGGGDGNGSIFQITLSGVFSTIYAFNSADDGNSPSSALIQQGNNLYGITMFGGMFGYGTIYSATLDGSESTLYSFSAGQPWGNLTYYNNSLYGVTGNTSPTYGVVFKYQLEN